jgi:hypothetical protein
VARVSNPCHISLILGSLLGQSLKKNFIDGHKEGSNLKDNKATKKPEVELPFSKPLLIFPFFNTLVKTCVEEEPFAWITKGSQVQLKDGRGRSLKKRGMNFNNPVSIEPNQGLVIVLIFTFPE